jgi:hypothetical protein
MNQNSFEKMLAQIVELMETIQKNKEPLKGITPELMKEIEQLEAQLAEANKTAQKLLKENSIDPKATRIDAMLSKQIPAKEKRAFERATKITRDTKILKNEIDKTLAKKKLKNSRNLANTKKTDVNKKQIKERRKRFKAIGGDKNWIPL